MEHDGDSTDSNTNPEQHQENTKQGDVSNSIQGKPHDKGTNDGKPTASTHPKPSLPVRFLRVMWRRRSWRRMSGHQGPNWAELITVGLTTAIVIVGFIQAGIYWTQARIMQDSLEQNERAIILGRGQLTVASRSAEATIKQFHLDQRAWISVEPVVARFVEKEKIQLEVRIHNTGKTPAINAKICTFAEHSIPDDSRDHPYPCSFEPQLAVGPVMPNETVAHNYGTPFEVWVGEKDMYVNPFSQHKLKLFTTGQFWYQDVFGCERWIKFCRYLDGRTGRLLPCMGQIRDETDDTNSCKKPSKNPR